MNTPLVRQFLAFGLVGTGGFVVDTATLYLAMAAGSGPYLGRVASYLVAATFTWALNRRFTFSAHASDHRLKEWSRFLLANGLGGLLNYGTFALLVSQSPFVRLHPGPRPLRPARSWDSGRTSSSAGRLCSARADGRVNQRSRGSPEVDGSKKMAIMDRPLLSIVVPAYNESAGIVAALRRLAGVALSTGLPTEIIVVDDGSRDATYARAAP